MKNLFLIPTITLLFFSCNSNGLTKKSQFDSIAPIDTTCQREVNSAKTDFLKGKMTYCHFIGMLTRPFRNENEMVALLKQYNINYKTELVSDVITDQTEGCYCDFMSEKIGEHFGSHFIDSLMNISDSIYLAKHISDTFQYMSCDTWARYPGDSDSNQTQQCAILQAQLDAKMKYPNGYIRRRNSEISAFADVDFIVNKAGEATIEGYNFLFGVNSNHRYERDFERQIAKIVKKDGWTSGQVRKQKVISNCVLRIFFE